MKLTITIFCSMGIILLTLILRTNVYQIRLQPHPESGKDHAPYLQDAEAITLHYHEKRPYYITYNNDVHGLVADPIRQAFAHAGLPYQWVKTPATRQLGIIENNQAKTCAAGWFKTPEREKFAKYSKPVYRDRPFIGITRSDTLLLQDHGTLTGAMGQPRLRLLVKDGYSYGKYIDQLIAEMTPRTVLTTADTSGMLEMILMQRADYMLLTEEEALDPLLFSKHIKTEFKLIRFTDSPAGNLRYIICSRKVSDHELDVLNDAITRLGLINERDESLR